MIFRLCDLRPAGVESLYSEGSLIDSDERGGWNSVRFRLWDLRPVGVSYLDEKLMAEDDRLWAFEEDIRSIVFLMLDIF